MNMKKIWTAFGCFMAGGVILGGMYLLGAAAAGAIAQSSPGMAIAVLAILVIVGWVGAIFFYLLGLSYVISAGVIDGQKAMIDELRQLRRSVERGGVGGAAEDDGDGLAELRPASSSSHHFEEDDAAVDALASLTDSHEPAAPAAPKPRAQKVATPPPPPAKVEVKVLRFNCVKCDAHLAAPLEHAGKRARCKKCGEVNDVPIG